MSTIRVLIVDDSAVYREFLSHLLRSDPRIEIAGAVRDGEAALDAVAALRPDVITMDVNMPGMDGYGAARRIMEVHPTPIIIVSGTEDAREVEMGFRAMESGAVAVVPKPRGGPSPESAAQSRELIQMVTLMAEVKVIRRWSRKRGPAATESGTAEPRGEARERDACDCRVVLIGGSTGAPPPLRTILSALPTRCTASVLVVQHIATGFVAGFAEWLAGASALPVHVALDGELLLPGHVYIAPDDVHMGVSVQRRIALDRGEPENGLRPSVSHLFRSALKVYGKSAAAVLLSGMGRDGADDLKALRDAGAVTFAQDRESSVVFGMPGEAVRLGAAAHIMPPESIAAAVAALTQAEDWRMAP